MHPRIVLGWREWVGLPGLGLAAVRAKIDSGARSSSLHVDRQWQFFEAGEPWVGFWLTPGASGDAAIERAAPVFDERDVTDSGGHRTRRIFVRTLMWLAGEAREIEINMCDRRGMVFPMLLGRTAMARTFTVDPARSFHHGRCGCDPSLAAQPSHAEVIAAGRLATLSPPARTNPP